MSGNRWLRGVLLLFLCLWPIYSILSIVWYRLQPTDVDAEWMDIEIEPYLVNDTSKMDGGWEVDEYAVLREYYVQAFQEKLKEVKEVLTDAYKQRLASPYRSQEDHAAMTALFRPLIACPSQRRTGIGQKGKWTCGLNTFLQKKKNCRVYAFNWNVTDLSFEFEFLNKTDCTVHVFDPFLPEEEKKRIGHLHPNLRFHDVTLGLLPDRRYLFDELRLEMPSVEEQRLLRIAGDLRHRWIDVLKLDYNGEEFMKIVELVVDWQNAHKGSNGKRPFPVGQILYQLSTGGNAKQIPQTMVSLMNLGFANFYTEPNLEKERPWEHVSFSFLNMRDRRTFHNKRHKPS